MDLKQDAGQGEEQGQDFLGLRPTAPARLAAETGSLRLLSAQEPWKHREAPRVESGELENSQGPLGDICLRGMWGGTLCAWSSAQGGRRSPPLALSSRRVRCYGMFVEQTSKY